MGEPIRSCGYLGRAGCAPRALRPIWPSCWPSSCAIADLLIHPASKCPIRLSSTVAANSLQSHPLRSGMSSRAGGRRSGVEFGELHAARPSDTRHCDWRGAGHRRRSVRPRMDEGNDGQRDDDARRRFRRQSSVAGRDSCPARQRVRLFRLRLGGPDAIVEAPAPGEGRDGWRVASTREDLADENVYNEDKFAVLLSPAGLPLIGAAIHLASAPIAGKPAASSGRGLHYTLGW